MDKEFPAAILLLMAIIFLVIVAMFVVSDIREDVSAIADRVTKMEACCIGADAKQ